MPLLTDRRTMRRKPNFVLFALAITLGLAGCASAPYKTPKAGRLFHQADNAMITHEWRVASAKYRELLATYPSSKYATQARLNLVYVYYRADQPDEAGSQADRFRKEDPASPYVPYVLYIKGLAYATSMQPGLMERTFGVSMSQRDPKDQQKAFKAFRNLVTEYPKSAYTERAKRWMVFVRNRLAKFNLGVARFYLRRKEWVAAVNRAATILTKFSKTPSAKPALKILERSYRALGEEKLATEAQKYYRFNFGSHATAD